MATRKKPPRKPTAAITAVTAATAGPPPAEGAWPLWGVALWGLAAHLVFLHDGSSTAFFFGDGLFFLQKARHLVEGTALDADLPFHPPLVAWLLVPLWWLAPAQVVIAAKTLMAVLNAVTYALVYRLLRARPAVAALALPIGLLLPLSFGELQLSATPNSETVYRLLLASLLTLGWRWPLVGGVLHALAALTRAEHLVFGLVLLGVGLARRERRRFALVTAATAALCLAPYLAVTAGSLASYNARHAAELPEPLPVLVPISFYGPLNFALAQTEEEIYFSRRTLPVTRGDAAALDPLDPVHNAAIVHGVRLGLDAIAERPGRFLARAAQKLAHSLRAFGHGFTWRDLPKGDTWTRRPVDMAYAEQPAWEVAVAALILLGVFALRGDRRLLLVAAVLLVYRLAMNVVFFPYLRGMTIVAPLAVVFLAAGLGLLLGRFARPALLAAAVLLGLVHLATGLGERSYLQAGERDARGAILDDRTVRLKVDG